MYLFILLCPSVQNFYHLVCVCVAFYHCQKRDREYMLGVWARSCVACTGVHAQHNIISRNIISHIAVMTLGRYVDYTVSKQQPADWVSILPYITSLHSSLCFFIGLIFPNHFPLLRFPGRGSRLCTQVMWSNMMTGRHNDAREEKLKHHRQY